MGYKKYTINLAAHVTGGASCSKPKIEWDDPLCAGISCIKNDGRIIEVTIPDDCDERCFWVTWSCGDPCNDDCDPIRLKVCPCETAADCEGGCQDCTGNLCVSRCEDDEFCNDADICIECDEEHPCPNGKICVAGECVCPPSKPHLNSKGECVPCTEDSCPPGKICTPDGCQDPECPEGVWHPQKEKCVECINSGHCEEANECCDAQTNTCVCCEGFIRDINTGGCVPKPPCETDDDCPDCEYCDGTVCVPVNCPPGFVCIPGEGCVKECDCSNPDCPEGSACVVHTSDICYCKPCTGTCPDGCSEGCFCDENDPEAGCQPNPCSNVPCVDGSECGVGCGCNKETSQCEPCASAECGDECDNLLGCECPNGNACTDVKGCDGPCDGYGDCPIGCTCVHGKCVPCSDFSCENDDCASHPECQCSDSGCEGNPDFCKDTFETDTFDCGVSAELRLTNGCMCPAVTAYVFPYQIAKTGIKYKYDVSVSMRLAKGFADTWPGVGNLHLLDDTQHPDIADNDTPESGTLNIEIREFYQPQIWQNNAWVNQGGIASRVLPQSGSFSFAGIAKKDVKFTAYGIGRPINIIPTVSQEKIVRYELGVSSSQLTFPNGCVYEPQTLDILRMDSKFKLITDELNAALSTDAFYDTTYYPIGGNYNIGIRLSQWEAFSSDSSRKPLFVWYRSEDGTYTSDEIIRKLYIGEDSKNRYEDILHGPKTFDPLKENLVEPEGRVFGNMYYKVTNDCGCGDRELDLGKQVWCNPESLVLGNIIFSNCNKKVEVKSDIGRPCATNRSLDEIDLHPDDDTQAFKLLHQAKYHLVIELENGTSVDLPYIWREVGVPFAGLYKLPKTGNALESIKNYTQTFTSPIVAMRLELKYGSSDSVVCVWEKTIPNPGNFTPTYTATCLENGKIAYRFNTAPNHITSIEAVGGTVTSGSGYKEVIADQGTEVTVYIEFTDYCPTTLHLNKDCCETLEATLSRTDVNGTTELTTTVTGGVAPYSVYYYRQIENDDPELVGESTNNSDNYKIVIADAEPGLYYAQVIDGNECETESPVISVDPRDQEDYPVPIAPGFNGCAYTGNVVIGIPQQPDVIGGKIYYKVDSGPEQYFTITNQMYTSGQNLLPAAGHTITLVRLEIPNPAGPATVFTLTGSATVPSDLTAEVPGVTTFTVNGVATTITICEGDEVLIELQGTPYTVVQFNVIAPITLDGSGYGSSIQKPTTSVIYAITAVQNTAGSCSGSQGVGLTRSVSVGTKPSIEVVSDECDPTLTYRTVTFNNITSATDQFGNPLTVTANSVTVQPGAGVTKIIATYDNGICVATYEHIVTSCNCPTATGTLTAPATVCEDETFDLVVSGVTGGTAPYSYNYYTDSEYNEIYILNQTTKTYGPTSSDTYHVRVQDSNGCISVIGSKTVQLIMAPEPNIVAQSGQPEITEVSDNVFEIVDTLANAIFKTEMGYPNINWLVTGTYGGTTVGTGPTFTIETAEITGTIVLRATVSNEAGCIGIEEVQISVVSAPALLTANEALISTDSRKFYKVTVTPSLGSPSLLCGAGQPATSVALRSNGDLIGAIGSALHKVSPLSGCSSVSIGSMNHVACMGMLNANTVVALGEGVTRNVLATFNLSTSTPNNSYYTISDAPNGYGSSADIVRVSNKLYIVCQQYVSGTPDHIALIELTLDGSDLVTAFANIGTITTASRPVGMINIGGTVYLFCAAGQVYTVNLGTAAVTFIGAIVVPGGEFISDATSNYV